MSKGEQKDQEASTTENERSKNVLVNDRILKGMDNMPEESFITWNTRINAWSTL